MDDLHDEASGLELDSDTSDMDRRCRCGTYEYKPRRRAVLTWIALAMAVFITMLVVALYAKQGQNTEAASDTPPPFVRPIVITDDDFVRPQRMRINDTLLQMDVIRNRWSSSNLYRTVLAQPNIPFMIEQMWLDSFGPWCRPLSLRPSSSDAIWHHPQSEREVWTNEMGLTEVLRMGDSHTLERNVRTHAWQTWDGRLITEHEFDTLFAVDAVWTQSLLRCNQSLAASIPWPGVLEQMMEQAGVTHDKAHALVQALDPASLRLNVSANVTTFPWTAEVSLFPCSWIVAQTHLPPVVRFSMPCLVPHNGVQQWMFDDHDWSLVLVTVDHPLYTIDFRLAV
jgi:hypothetical protein